MCLHVVAAVHFFCLLVCFAFGVRAHNLSFSMYVAAASVLRITAAFVLQLQCFLGGGDDDYDDDEEEEDC